MGAGRVRARPGASTVGAAADAATLPLQRARSSTARRNAGGPAAPYFDASAIAASASAKPMREYQIALPR